MEVFVEHIGAMQFDIKARQHSVVCDQPVENGGREFVSRNRGWGKLIRDSVQKY